ncbi:MAG TPA: carbohydrate ABC transporter permease [Chloroflexi bacterium]|jgi:putative aldouronate transport system permease protein|nr:carbohydrate ABC transporter permease [Chloroflexota bacterium]
MTARTRETVVVSRRRPSRSGLERFNRVPAPINILFSLIFIFLALAAVIPLVFVIIISLSSDQSVQMYGYRFIPKGWTTGAYTYLWMLRDYVGRAFLVSVGTTIVGTILGIFLNATLGYVISRRTYALRGFFTILIFIPMLFSGGLVASYMVNTQLLGLGNTYWALILPLTTSSFFIIILRTFFQTTIPDEIIESARIDGASQFLIFFRIVLPLSLPAVATIGLFLSFSYWNSWFPALLYIQSTHAHMYPLQYVLMSIERTIQELVRNAQFMLPAEAFAALPTEAVRMAIVVVVVLPIALSYPYFQRYFITGLTIGAVKG